MSSMPKDKVNSIEYACVYQRKLASQGFDWPDKLAVIDKLYEELGELKQAVAEQESPSRVEEEYGDLLLVMMHLSNHLNLDVEHALNKSMLKLKSRYKKMTSYIKEGQSLTLDEMMVLWNKAKQETEK